MATYKVLQDIEAEDKILGWLTPRQMLYAAIVVVSILLAGRLGMVRWYLVLPFLPPIVLFGFLAAPIGTEQSSELWLLAKIKFFLKPRRRIWDQSGIKELVSVTAPKHDDKQLTDNLSQTEVKSRLQALANTIDSRGWAIKNVNVNLYSQPAYLGTDVSDERLINPDSLPVDVPIYDVRASDDILDERNNPTAQHLSQLISQSAERHKQQAIAQMHLSPEGNTDNKTQPDYWFMNSPASDQVALPDPNLATFDHSQVISPGQNNMPSSTTSALSPQEEKALLDKIHANKDLPNPTKSHLKTILPIDQQKKRTANQAPVPAKTEKAPVTPPANPDILNLANNDDLNVATIARQANKSKGDAPDGEVVVSLR